MSFTDRPTPSASARIGCLAYGIIGTIIVLTIWLATTMGDAAPPPLGLPEPHSGALRFFAFPFSLAVFIAGGVFLAWCVTRDRD